MTMDEFDDLAHDIAEEYCKSFIDAETITVKDSVGNEWHDLDSASTEVATAEGIAWQLKRAVTYLETPGILKRSPENPRWVSWDEDDTLSETANVWTRRMLRVRMLGAWSLHPPLLRRTRAPLQLGRR